MLVLEHRRGGRHGLPEMITIEPGKMGGKPCIRGMRMTVYDVLDYLASGMTEERSCTTSPTSHATTFGLAWPSPQIARAPRRHSWLSCSRPERLSMVVPRAGRSFPGLRSRSRGWPPRGRRYRHLEMPPGMALPSQPKDADFRQRSFLEGHPPKIIRLRLGNCSSCSLLSPWEESEISPRGVPAGVCVPGRAAACGDIGPRGTI